MLLPKNTGTITTAVGAHDTLDESHKHSILLQPSNYHSPGDTITFSTGKASGWIRMCYQ